MEQYCQNKIAIVGAGPAGIYCAINILKNFKKNNFNNFKLTIFDKGQILRTILPTGGGRCNITNATDNIEEFIENYPRGSKFLRSIFSRHFNTDSVAFFNSIGIRTYTAENKRIYPLSNSAKEVRDKLLNELKKYNNISLINKKINKKSELNDYNYIVISAGSRNTDSLLESFGHKIVPFKKALVGLKVENMIYPEGVSVKSSDGDFIFTKNGISGPLALTLSSLNAYKEFPYEISIKLFDYSDLEHEISNNSKKTIGNILSNLIPKSLAKVIAPDFNKKAAEISKRELNNLTQLKLKIKSTEDSREMTNAGGINLDDIDKNCKSKLNDNLWFCGEVLNIDGLCGGFNLQNCWSSAYIVANDLVTEIVNRKNNP